MMGGSLRTRDVWLMAIKKQCVKRQEKGGLRPTATENGEKNGEGIKFGITEIALRQLHGASPLQGIKVIEAYCFIRNMVKFYPARKYIFPIKNA